ncbi:MAG TPA: damage-inducible mutagenesis protein [Alphaproteobacteria bacterium]|jgi:protein ImuA|nr:damage-inducible mutagenesis protein [Alphaproteobacteria bacterium]
MTLPTPPPSHAARLAQAAALIRAGLPKGPEGRPCMGTGAAKIDEALPWGGLTPGLHEIAAAHGDAARAGFVASLLGRRPGPVLWCRSHRTALEAGDPYGPGIARLGLAPDRLILAEAAKPAELLWAMEEGARTKGLAAVVADGVMPDLTAGRRLQLAAEAGQGLVLLLATSRQSAASTALTRWFIASAPSRPEAEGPGRPCWTVELWRCRGGRPREWMVEWDDAALSLSVVAPMADRPLAAAVPVPAGPASGLDGAWPGRDQADRGGQDGGADGTDRRDDLGGRKSAAA